MNEWTFDPVSAVENRWFIVAVWAIALAGYLYFKFMKRR